MGSNRQRAAVRIFLLALAFLILANSAVTWTRLSELVTTQNWVTHTQNVRRVLARLEYLAESAETVLREYRESGSPSFLDRYRVIEAQLRSDVRAIRELTRDNDEQQQRIQRLSVWLNPSQEAHPDVFRQLAELKAVAHELDEVEHELLDERIEESASSARAAYVTIAAATALTLVLLLVAWSVTRREMERRLQDEQRLREAKEWLQLVIDSVPQRIFWRDADFHFVGCNKAFVSDTGMSSKEEVIGRTEADFQPPELVEKYRQDEQEVIRTRQPKLGYEEQLLRPDGSRAWVRSSKVPLFSPDGAVAGVLCTYEDITERKQFESELRLRNRAIEASVNAIVITDALHGNQVVYANPAFEVMTGYSAAEMIGRDMRLLQNGDHEQADLQRLREAIAARRTDHVLLRNYRRDGTMFWNDLRIAPVADESGQVTHFVGVLQDVTQTKCYQEQLEHQATHDPLTGLPNRALLLDRLRQAVQHAKRLGTHVTVAFIDLDGFKSVNDSMGHEAGDQLLRMMADRLRRCLRESDTVARLGGDEYVLVMCSSALAPDAQLQRVLEEVSQPLELEGRELYVTASLGSSVYPQDGEDAEELLQKADTAMYRSKDLGRNTFQAYSRQMSVQHSRRLALLAALRHAVHRKELLLHYQPRVDLGSGRVVGLEALVRWEHPEKGMVSPAEFIPMAEESGLIEGIGNWVLHTACAQARAWQAMGIGPLQMAVNLSARQLRHKEFVSGVRAVLEGTGLDKGMLELELTESALMEDPEAARCVMEELKALGVLLSIDDFGTGYSSLSYLQRFPVDHLKIDRSFVRGLPASSDDAAIARTVIGLGHSLGLRVVAEGVETREQAAFLRELGCNEVQGFYFSRPLPAPACQALLLSGATLDLPALKAAPGGNSPKA